MSGMKQHRKGRICLGSEFHGAVYPGGAGVVTGGARSGSRSVRSIRLSAHISVDQQAESDWAIILKASSPGTCFLRGGLSP